MAPEKLRQGKGQLVGKGNLALKYFRQNRCRWEEKGREPAARKMRLRGKGCWWKERNLAPEKLRQGKGQLVGKGKPALKYFRQNRCRWEEKGWEPDAEVLSSKTKNACAKRNMEIGH